MIKVFSGQKFGSLIVVREVASIRAGKAKQSVRRVEVRCDCGKSVEARLSSVRNGQSKKASASGKLRRKAPGEHAINSVVNTYVQAARRRKHAFELSREQVVRLIFSNCYYCGSEPKNVRGANGMFGSIRYNGIDRVDNSKGYTDDNCVPCCETCNKAKNKMTFAEFADWVKRLIQHFPKHESI